MADFNELSQQNDHTNGSGPDESEKNIHYDLHCNVDPKLKQTENFPDKENTCIKHEEIAEFEELFEKNESVNGNTPHASGTNNIQNDIHCDSDQTFSETENITHIEDEYILKEEIKLLRFTSDLQEVIINLLQQKLKLLDIKDRRFKSDIFNSVEDVQKAINGTLRSFLENAGILQISELENILKIVESTNTELQKDFVDNVEQILEETHSKFLMYKEVYTTCKTYLENFLQKAEKLLNINIVPNNSKKKRSALFSILEVTRLRRINLRLASVKKAFHEFEAIMKNYTKTSAQNIDKIDLLLTVFEKSELAYREIKLVTVELLKFEIADV